MIKKLKQNGNYIILTVHHFPYPLNLMNLMQIIFNVVPRQKYCESIHKTIRRKTRTVMVGNVALGSEHRIRIQTMTTTDTKDVSATVEQVLLVHLVFIVSYLRYYFNAAKNEGYLSSFS